jgi:hypothetical protein
MLPFTIAICGEPLVGKTSLVMRLKDIAGGTISCIKHPDSQLQLSGDYDGRAFTITNVAGCVLHREFMYGLVLSGARCVVYVAALRDQYPGSDGELGSQEDHFNSYWDQMTKLKKTWADIPWILVLNKVDRGGTGAFLAHFPDALRNQAVQTNAAKGTGVDVLWDRIVTVVNAG